MKRRKPNWTCTDNRTTFPRSLWTLLCVPYATGKHYTVLSGIRIWFYGELAFTIDHLVAEKHRMIIVYWCRTQCKLKLTSVISFILHYISSNGVQKFVSCHLHVFKVCSAFNLVIITWMTLLIAFVTRPSLFFSVEWFSDVFMNAATTNQLWQQMKYSNRKRNMKN